MIAGGPIDADRLAELYRRYAPLVHARARRIVGSDADDVVQETFMKLLASPPDPDATTAWMYTTATNLCLDRLRHRKRRDDDWQAEVGRMTDAGGGSPSIDDVLASQELARRVLAGVDRKLGEVAVLVYFDELGIIEAADRLQISRKTAGERLQRFREHAAKMVKRWQS